MAHTHKTTEKYHTANGSTTSFDFPFEYYKNADVHVTIDTVAKTEGTHYDINTGGTAVVFKTSPTDYTPANNAVVRIYRDTDVNTSKATFAAGSSIRATDLNNNETQLLFSAQEKEQKIIEADIRDGAITSAKIKDGTIATADIADNAVTAAKIGTNAIDASNLAANSVGASELADDAVDTDAIADDAVTSAKIATGAVIADGLATNAVTSAKITTGAITADKIGSSAVTSAKIDNNAIVAAKIATDAVTETKILDSSITVNKIANDAVTIDKIADNAVDSQHYVDGSIDSEHIANTAVTTEKLNNNAVTNAKMADDSVDTAELVDDAVTVAKIDNAQLTTLAGMQSGTASILAGSTALTSTTAELNLLDGKSIVTSVSGSSTDTQLPSAKAVNDQIVSLLNDAGGFVPIADDQSFPNTNPDPDDGAGTIVSIADAGGLVVNGSGVTTTGRTLGGSTVTINGIDSSLNSSTIAAGKGMLVQTTSTLNTYTYHRLVVDEAGVSAAQTLVSDFNERYRVASSAPSSSLDEGDLWYDTGNDEMKVYDTTLSAFKAISSTGNYSLLALRNAANNGSAVYDGSIKDYTLVTKGTTSAVNPNHAAQLIVSLNGVIQEPNTGTSTPTNGFALNGSTIKFSNNLPSGTSVFIAKIGATVDIGTPSSNTVTSAILQNGSVIKAKIGADAVDGTKIEDDAVAAEHLASDAVVTASIVDDAVTADKLANSINTEIAANTAKVTNATHTGEVTGATALTIADDVVDEANLKISNAGSNGQFLSKQSGNTGGLTWADAASEGTDIASTGESGGTKYLREDGDGTCSWQSIPAGVGGAAGVDFNDDVLARWGTSNDFAIKHIAGSYTSFDDVTDSAVFFTTDNTGTGWQFRKRTGSAKCLEIYPGAGVHAYHNSNEKLATSADGISVTGNVIATTEVQAQGFESPATVAANWSIGANNNAMFPGPMTVASGVTVTVPANRTLTVV